MKEWMVVEIDREEGRVPENRIDGHVIPSLTTIPSLSLSSLFLVHFFFSPTNDF